MFVVKAKRVTFTALSSTAERECFTCKMPKVDFIKWQQTDAPAFKRLVLDAGAHYKFRFTAPLPTLQEGDWKADFGSVSVAANGELTYTAPLFTLPDHLDHLNFTSTSNSAAPIVHLWIAVRGAQVSSDTVILLPDAMDVNPMTPQTTGLTSTPPSNGASAAASAIAASPDECLAETALTPYTLPGTATVANTVYYQTGAEVDSGTGVLLIAWDKQKSPPKNCTKPPYHNPKPDRCQGSAWQENSPVYENTSTTEFRTTTFEGTVSGDIKAQLAAQGETIGANGSIKITYKYKEVKQVRTRFIDYWQCVNGKPKFLYTMKCTRQGFSYLYLRTIMGRVLGGTTPQWIPPYPKKPSCIRVSVGW